MNAITSVSWKNTKNVANSMILRNSKSMYMSWKATGISMIIKEDYEDFKGVFFPMSSYWKQKFNLKPKYRGRVYDSDFDDD